MQLLRDWKFSLVTAIALIGSILVLVNVSIHRGNRTLQADVAQRQQFINQSIQLARLNNEIIQALARLSAETNDESIRQLLADQGVTFTVNPPAAETTDE
jgi:histidinol phosphatase-like PHP family hydrolase